MERFVLAMEQTALGLGAFSHRPWSKPVSFKGLKNPLHGSHNSLSRVSKFPSVGLIIPLAEGRSNASSEQTKHAFKGQRTGLELIGGEIERGFVFAENNQK